MGKQLALIALYFVLCYATLFAGERTVHAATEEGGAFEYLGAVGLLAAGLLNSARIEIQEANLSLLAALTA